MDALPGQRVEVYGKGFHQGFPFTGAHFGNLALMQHDTADKLHIVMHHVPSNQVAPGHPLVLVIGLVAPDGHIVAGRSQVPVPRHGGHLHLGIVLETLGCGLDHGEGFGQNLVEDILGLAVDFLFQLVNRTVDMLLFFYGKAVVDIGGNLGFERIHLVFLFLDPVLDFLFELLRLGTELVVAQLGNRLVGGQALIQNGPDFLEVALGLAAEQFLE